MKSNDGLDGRANLPDYDSLVLAQDHLGFQIALVVRRLYNVLLVPEDCEEQSLPIHTNAEWPSYIQIFP